MRKKKSKFLTFCLSFIPGAGEMYMGFMKMGISLMGIFALIMTLAIMLNIGPVMILGVVVWFYSSFHANNLRSMRDEEFYALEDTYLFHTGMEEMEMGELFRKYRNLIAWILVIIGVCLVWNNLLDLLVWSLPDEIAHVVRDISYRIPQLVIGIGIIAAGVLMIKGKKKGFEEDGAHGTGAQRNGAYERNTKTTETQETNAQTVDTYERNTKTTEAQETNAQATETQGKAE